MSRVDMHRVSKKIKNDKLTKALKEYEVLPRPHINYNLLAMVIILLLLSCIVVYSTTYETSLINGYYSALNRYDGNLVDFNPNGGVLSADSLKQHVVTIIMGIAIMCITIFIKPSMMKFLSYAYYAMTCGLVLLVPFFGTNVWGQTRWIKIGGLVSIQPSDFYKVGLILFLSFFLYKRTRDDWMDPKFLLKLAIFTLPFIGIIIVSDLSTGFVILCIVLANILIMIRKPFKFLTIAGVIGGAGIIGLILMQPYRISRIMGWINLEGDAGQHTLLGLHAISSGGLFGKGIGNSIMKSRVPASSNDFVFTIICEEFGIIGGILLVGFFALLIREIYRLAISTQNTLFYLILVGCMTHISMQIIINIGVTLNLIPNTGIGLPFLSTGGSSIVSFLFEMGIILNLSRLINRQRINER